MGKVGVPQSHPAHTPARPWPCRQVSQPLREGPQVHTCPAAVWARHRHSPSTFVPQQPRPCLPFRPHLSLWEHGLVHVEAVVGSEMEFFPSPIPDMPQQFGPPHGRAGSQGRDTPLSAPSARSLTHQAKFTCVHKVSLLWNKVLGVSR